MKRTRWPARQQAEARVQTALHWWEKDAKTGTGFYPAVRNAASEWKFPYRTSGDVYALQLPNSAAIDCKKSGQLDGQTVTVENWCLDFNLDPFFFTSLSTNGGGGSLRWINKYATNVLDWCSRRPYSALTRTSSTAYPHHIITTIGIFLHFSILIGATSYMLARKSMLYIFY